MATVIFIIIDRRSKKHSEFEIKEETEMMGGEVVETHTDRAATAGTASKWGKFTLRHNGDGHSLPVGYSLPLPVYRGLKCRYRFTHIDRSHLPNAHTLLYGIRREIVSHAAWKGGWPAPEIRRAGTTN